jgi:hypothetical protein
LMNVAEWNDLNCKEIKPMSEWMNERVNDLMT